MCFNDEQFIKTPFSIFIKKDGIIICLIDLQLLNAYSFIICIVWGIDTFSSEIHPSNA